MFELHPNLEKDTIEICDLEISKALLMNDARFLWVILVPKIEGAIEWHDLSQDNQTKAFEETMAVSKILKSLSAAKKINIGALGNMVPQLHIHIIARNENDAAWPGPVWGNGKAVPYETAEAKNIIEKIEILLAQI